MKYSKTAMQMAERFEGCELKAYADQGGVLTIGYGHTLGVYKGMMITLAQAEMFLQEDLDTASVFVDRLVTVELSQNEFDALVDFVFNLGPTNFQRSTMLKLVNMKQFDLAANEFDKWDRCGGRIVSGLLRRRQAEMELFKDAAVQNT